MVCVVGNSIDSEILRLFHSIFLVVVNYCLSQPCHNGGTCISEFGGYTCECPHDYTGHNCENLRKPHLENDFREIYF